MFNKVHGLAVALGAAFTLTACTLPPLRAYAPSANATAAPRAQSVAPAQGQTDSAVRELALRLLSSPYPPGMAYTPPDPELVVNAMPAIFPADLPIPPNTHILGGLQRGDATGDLIADSETTSEAAVQFVSDGLKAQGWSEPPNMSPGGFIPTGMLGASFCRGEDGPSLSVMVTQRAGSLTELRYSLNTFKGMPSGAYGPCNQPVRGPGFTPLPRLSAPDGAKQGSLGMSGSPDSMLQFAALETEQTPPQLLAHYAAQLQQANWELTASGGTDDSAWSNWSFKDDQGKDQTALLFIAPRVADKPVQFVLLEVSTKR